MRPACRVVHGGEMFHGKQGLDSFSGITAESAGARGICMHLVTIPPGVRANAQLHQDHETAICVLSGEATMWYGEGLSEQVTIQAGYSLYVPAGAPHLPANLSQSTPCVGVRACTDPNEQEGGVLCPELDSIAPWPRDTASRQRAYRTREIA